MRQVIGCWLLVLLGGVAGAAEQIVVFDREITVTRGQQYYPCDEGIPTNWVEPVDYSNAWCHVEWEIIEAPPEAAELVLQFGWVVPGNQGDNSYHLTRYAHMVRGEEPPMLVQGTRYHTSHQMNNRNHFWPVDDKDYSMGIERMMSFLRNPQWNVVGPPGTIRLRITMTLVPDGATYQPPSTYGGVRSDDLPALPTVQEAMLDREPGRALAVAETLEADGVTGDAAIQLVTALTALRVHIDDELAALEQRFANDPVVCAQRLQVLREAYAGTSRAERIETLVETWRDSDVLRTELRAHRDYERARELVEQLRASAGAEADFTDAATQQAHARELRDLGRLYMNLLRRYPDSAARRHTADLLRGLGIEPPEPPS